MFRMLPPHLPQRPAHPPPAQPSPTLGSAALSLALLGLMIAMYINMFYGKPVSDEQTTRIVCRHKVSLTQALPSSYLRDIQAMPAVRYVTSYSWFGGTYIDSKHFWGRFAVDHNIIFDIYSDFEISPAELDAFKKERTACAISDKLAHSENIKLGDTLVIDGDIYPVKLELKVAAIFKTPPEYDALFFHQDYLMELLRAADPKTARWPTPSEPTSSGQSRRISYPKSRVTSMKNTANLPAPPTRNLKRSSAVRSWHFWEISSCIWRRSVPR